MVINFNRSRPVTCKSAQTRPRHISFCEDCQ